MGRIYIQVLDNGDRVTVSSGDPVTVIGRSEDGKWLQVRTTSDTVGWVYGHYIRPKPADNTADYTPWFIALAIVTIILSFLWAKQRRWLMTAAVTLAVALTIRLIWPKLWPPPPPPPLAATVTGSQQADDLLTAGNSAFAHHDFQRAIRQYSQVISMAPAYAPAYIARGNAEVGLMQYDQALANYESAIQKDSDNAVAYFGAGTARWYNGDLTGAEKDYRNAVNYDSGEELYYSRLARVLTEENRKDEIGTIYEKAYDDDNGRDWALTGWLASVAVKQDYQSLWSLCNQRLRDGADNAPFHFYRALTDVKLKQHYDEAIADLKGVVNTDPENLALYAYSELAEAYRATHQIQLCEDSLMRYQTLNGYTETTQEKEKAEDAASKFCSREGPQ